jgi:cell division protein FtsI/penicillin-binding protein 2
MLVAIRSSTGGILAVAQNAAAGETPNALNGLYAPGSTFKIATATAAMTQAGMSPDSDVQCPGTGTFGGRLIKNANSFDEGAIKLHVAFAKSCNTTFADIAAKLPADGLKKAADQLGLNSNFTIPGITTELGKVEAASNPTQRVEDGIGQGKVLASPLGMAVVAATVASGKKITPKLWIGNDTHVGADYQPPPGTHLASLRQMMGEVVSSGTATTLRGLRVSGKTGTAETNNDGTKAHGWFVGFKGDVAFAVLVVDAGSSKAALDVSRAFAAALK